MHDLLIRNGQIVSVDGVWPACIAVSDGKITAVDPEISGPAKEEIDAAGLHVFPGLIDVHVHFNDPGRADWEGAATGSAALAAGGGTCFFDMPLNSSPPVLDRESFDRKVAALSGKSYADFGLWGGLTPNSLDRMDELANRGVVGFKAFMSNSGIDDFARADDLTLYRGMQMAARLGLPVAVHAENEELTSRLSEEARLAGRIGVDDYLASRPVIAEVDAIRRAIAYAQETGCSVHIVHISSAAGSQEVVEARHLWRRDGNGAVSVTGETCPHYLALNGDDVRRLGAVAKCAPPLRSPEESKALLEQLATGGIDMVASDHSPAPASMKRSNNFFDIWGGIAGVQSTLTTLLTYGVPLPQVVQLTAAAPAERFRIPSKGKIAANFDADFSLVEVEKDFILKRENLLDRHKLSPYVGRTFRGIVHRTILRGQTVFADGKIVGPPTGRLVKPVRS